MVHRHVAEGKHHAATRAYAFLPPIERVLVRPVIGQLAQVRAGRYVLPVVNIVEQRPPVFAQALEHKPRGHGRQVYANPLAIQPVSGD